MNVSLSDFVPALAALEAKVAAWNTARAEEADRDEAWADVVPVGRVLLLKSIELFDEVLGASTSVDEDFELMFDAPPDELQPMDEEAANDANTDTMKIDDLVFVAKLEARQMLQQLDRQVDEPSKWLILETCQRARRRTLRALTALGKSIQRELGVDASSDRFVEELRRSLRCRAALARLWHRMETTSTAPAFRRLRAAGTAIAVLHGGESYRELRLGDRRALRTLQERLLRWLRDPERSDPEAERLLQDLEGFVSLTRQISRRSELIEHDRALIAQLLDRLGTDPSDECVATVFDASFHLRGLSPELDRLLATKRVPTADSLRSCLLAVSSESRAGARRLGSTREFERARDASDSKQARP